MRRLMRVGLLLLAGCQNVNGPFRRTPERVDDPCLPTIGEKMRRSRDQLAFPDGSSAVAPRTGAEIPNATGR